MSDSMTSRERVMAAFEYVEGDRVPCLRQPLAGLDDLFVGDDVLENLDDHRGWIEQLEWSFYEYIAIRVQVCQMPIGHCGEVHAEDGITEDLRGHGHDVPDGSPGLGIGAIQKLVGNSFACPVENGLSRE